MAKFGPALFQYFADTVQYDLDGYVKPYKQKDYEPYGFGPTAEKTMDTFKNAIFKVIMLRARNEAILNRLCGRQDEETVTVNFDIKLADIHLHKTIEEFVDMDAELLKKLKDDYAKAEAAEDCVPNEGAEHCGPNELMMDKNFNGFRQIHSRIPLYIHDKIAGYPTTNLSKDLAEAFRPMTCGAKIAKINSHLEKVGLQCFKDKE